MNIAQAKEEIVNAVKIYLAKDEFGAYRIPVESQRPIFLLGAPGIGKTAIMEQVARELGVGLVSYSMTHHTRQSALGLPFVEVREFGGREHRVSEYTMSEIIAAVYESMEETGLREGILFLDEINCVSETLTPAILQFLQYKTFGRHRVPDGWVVVTAGNPAEYNRSTHDFDVATWDRVKRIDVEPDYAAWKAYALANRVHPAVVTYLDVEGDDFYHVETTLDGKAFVTARGWDDLSRAMVLYEERGMAVTERLMAQYLQDARIAKRFAVYYDLFNKYRASYQVDAILSGNAPDDVVARAQAAPFDERLALVGLLVNGVVAIARRTMAEDAAASLVHEKLKGLGERVAAAESTKAALAGDEFAQVQPDDLRATFSVLARELAERIAQGREHRSLSADERTELAGAHRFFADRAAELGVVTFDDAKAAFAADVERLDARVSETSAAINAAYAFLDEAFGVGKETLLFTTDISADASVVRFVNRYGSHSYVAHGEELMFEERGASLREAAQALQGEA